MAWQRQDLASLTSSTDAMLVLLQLCQQQGPSSYTDQRQRQLKTMVSGTEEQGLMGSCPGLFMHGLVTDKTLTPCLPVFRMGTIMTPALVE